MNILVLGGAGFVGAALLRHFSARHVCTGFDAPGRFEPIQPLLPAGLRLLEGDVADPAAVRPAMEGVDAVINAAGTGGEGACLEDPFGSLRTHVAGNHLVLTEALRRRLPHYIYFSTIAVYATYNPRPMPLTEAMEPRPDEFYGQLKAVAEREILDFSAYPVLRCSNIYGFGSGRFSYSMGVIARFVEAALRGRSMRLFGGGTQGIDYVHVADVAAAIETLLERPASGPFNVGGGAPCSLQDLSARVALAGKEILGRDTAVETVPAPPGKSWPDRWLAMERLEKAGWRPRVSLDEGIREMLLGWKNLQFEN